MATTPADPPSEEASLRAAAARFLDTGALDRSVPLRRLFDYLLDATIAGRLLREADVALEVFGRGADPDQAQDATIRVHIHRLRRKLEEYRLAERDETVFVAIPRGEYRLVLEGPDDAEEAADLPDGAGNPRRRWVSPPPWVWALAALLLVNVAGWIVYTHRDHRPAALRGLEDAPFWASLMQSPSPTIVVVGDYYIVGEAANGIEVSRLVREFSINSRDDLDEYLMQHPDKMGQLVDLDLHYLPVSAAPALRSLLGALDAMKGAGRVRVITMSQLTPDIVRGSNVIYVGYLSGLGILRDVVFDASSLQVGASYDELIDTKSDRRFTSDWSQVASGETPKRDFGYLANIALPGNRQLVVIAGTRDAALIETAEAATDPRQLAEIARQAGDARSSEALLEVTAIGNAALTGKLILARPLAATPPRAASLPGEHRFPDEVSHR